MSHFIRLLGEEDKASGLAQACDAIRSGATERSCFELASELFAAIPGSPFAYWTTKSVLSAFSDMEPFAIEGREAWVGLQTNDDFQWVRAWWESDDRKSKLFALVPFAKGGAFSPYYADVYLSVRWGEDGSLIKTWKLQQLKDGKISANNSKCWNEKNYFDAGITWPSRTQTFGPRILPADCIFAHKGPSAFFTGGRSDEILAGLAILNSVCFRTLVETRLNAADATARSFEVGTIEATPFPKLVSGDVDVLAGMASKMWRKRRQIDAIVETSHAFHLPATLLGRLGYYDPASIETELADIQTEIDEIAFNLYGFSEADRAAALGSIGVEASANSESEIRKSSDDSEDDEGDDAAVNQADGLLSWALGVAFGRFDWRLATGEREAPPEPNPFDPLPAKSPGMLPDGASPFHEHIDILVDDQGHPHDLARLVEEVLARVQTDVPGNVRRWLQRDFFPLHLRQYSKSRRKAPIYWPLSTTSGSYTLWLYYPSLTNQTLYTAVNDLVEPKLKQVSRDTATLRDKGASRSRDNEKAFEALQTLELELIELRDTLLQIAPTYRPNHDDGVQITAAPLWKLFRHKPWQKILKDTWAKLEKGDYDWAHLALAYWPDRVREKCKTDKSLAIAHDLEQLYVADAPKAPTARGRKKGGAA